MKEKERRDEIIPIRVTKSVKEGLQEIAERKERSVNFLMFSVLEAYVKKHSKK